MQIGIVGFPQAGKTSVFTALTGEPVDPAEAAGRSVIRRVDVPDPRLGWLAELHNPRKVTPATVEVIDFGAATSPENQLAMTRDASTLMVVLRAFDAEHFPRPADPARDLRELDDEYLLADMQVAENRIAKLRKSTKRPSPEQDRELAELALLERLFEEMEEGTPLREVSLSDEEEHMIRGFQFLTLKPRVVVHNIDEGQVGTGDPGLGTPDSPLRIAASLEAELVQLEEEERRLFADEMGIEESAADRIIQAAYRVGNLISFLTAGEKEVRAWPIPRGSTAVEAAGKIHTDLARGFVRAEVVSFDELKAAGSMKEVKSRGQLRLEGKDYIVRDGDVMEILSGV